LHPELFHAEDGTEALGADERGEARVEADARLLVDREQLAVAPEIPRSARDRLAGEDASDRVVVVGHLERAEARLADVERRDRRFGPAFPAAEALHVGHRASLLRRSSEAEQAGQLGRRARGARRHRPDARSMMSSESAYASVLPVSRRTASAAWSAPA